MRDQSNKIFFGGYVGRKTKEEKTELLNYITFKLKNNKHAGV